MTAGCASANPMYQLARINHSSSSPVLSSAARCPRRSTGAASTTTSLPMTAASRTSDIPTYAVLAKDVVSRRWRRVISVFFVLNVVATFAMFGVAFWRLTELKEIKIKYIIGDGNPSPSPLETDLPNIPRLSGIRYSLGSRQIKDKEDTCKYETDYQEVSLWGTAGQGDIPNNTNIAYVSTESCFKVKNSGNYIVYNQLTFGCPSPGSQDPASTKLNNCTRTIMYSQGIYVKDSIGRDQSFELKDTWQSIQPLTTERDKICHTSRLFGMIKLLESSRVCVKATPNCLLRSGPGLSFFGLYQV